MKDNKFEINEENETKKPNWVDNILVKFGVERYEEEEDETPENPPKKEKEKKTAAPAEKPEQLKTEIKKEQPKTETKEYRFPKSVVEPANQTKNLGGNMNNYEETSARMRVFTPTEVAEVRDVCDELKKGYAVVVNTDNLTEEDYCRFYDFVYGAAYMIDGKVSQISDTVLILTPATIDISRAVREEEIVEDDEDEIFPDEDENGFVEVDELDEEEFDI